MRQNKTKSKQGEYLINVKKGGSDNTVEINWYTLLDKQYHPFCRLKLLIETFRHHYFWTSQSEYNNSMQSFWANE